MELKQRRNFRNEPSNCRSFGSDNLPCSQSRKISIGVMAEEPLKGDGTRKEDETTLPNAVKAASTGGKFIEEKNKGPGIIASSKGKQTETSTRENSPWICTKSLRQETPTTKSVQFYENRVSILQSGDGTQKKFNSTMELPKTKTVKIFANQTSILQYGDGVQKQFNTMSEAPMSKTVQFYANQTSILHSSNDVQEKFNSITYGRTREKGGRTERVEEFAFAAAQEVRVSDKGAEGNKEKTACQSNESLKVKLWEILGTAPSQNERKSNSQTLEVGVKNSRLAGNLDQKSSRAVKPRQNSDTIETDSESPTGTARRPVTRSLARKKALTKAQPKLQYKIDNRQKLPSSSNNRQQCQEKNIFAFHEVEGWSGSLRGTDNGGSYLYTSKKNEKKSSRIEPRRINFFDKVDPEKSKRPSSEKKMTSHSNRTESFHSHPSQTKIESRQPKIGNLEEDLHHSPVRKKIDRPEDLNIPKVTKKADSQDKFGIMSLKKTMNQQDNVNSPALGMKTPIESYSPSPPSQKVKLMEPGGLSPRLVERRFTSEGFCNLRTSQTSKPGSSGSDAQTESSDGCGSLRKSPIRELSHVKEKDAEDRKSQSSKEWDVESLEEDVPINKGCRITETWTPESGSPEKPTFMLRSRKRLCSQISEFDPTSPSPKGKVSLSLSDRSKFSGTEESARLQEPSDQNHEDGLARAVSLFAFALEKFKTRMKAETSKRSSEILVSVAEGIKLQLQIVDSQIQRDIGKFTSLGKSKRKRLETRFQEQQERLKLIHDKFKEEINQHLQDSRSTLDDLEAYQIELKGNAEKQNTSHRKLLLQVEEAIETQLSDAERRITAVQQVAREKMFQLKHVITECLKDGVFS